MTISGVSDRTAAIASNLINLKNQLDNLTTQLSTGVKGSTYQAFGTDTAVATGLRAQLSAYASYSNTATLLNTRIQVANMSLQGISDAMDDVKNASANPLLQLNSTGQTASQVTAESDFMQIISLLNSNASGRYLFSGRATDTPSTASADAIMNGIPGQNIAGFKQVLQERSAADGAGVGGMGRVTITPPPASGSSFSIATDGSPFGLKLTGYSAPSSTSVQGGSLTGTAIPGWTGTSASLSTLSGIADGSTITVNGKTITIDKTNNAPDPAAVPPDPTAVPAGSTLSPDGQTVTDSSGNMTVYLNDKTGAAAGTIGDVLSAIGIAAGPSASVTADATGTISIQGTATTTISITAPADTLNALGLTSATGASAMNLSIQPVTVTTPAAVNAAPSTISGSYTGTALSALATNGAGTSISALGLSSGSTITVNGKTITIDTTNNAPDPAAVPPNPAALPAGSTLSPDGQTVTDAAGNMTVYLNDKTGAPAGTVGDVLSAIDAASGTVDQSTIDANGKITLQSSASANLDISGSADVLHALGLTSKTGTTTASLSIPPAKEVSIDLSGANLQEGSQYSFTFQLPDGTSQSVSLTATNTDPPPAGSFLIGANTAATAANLSTALTSAVGTVADTSLVAASAVQSANDFFGNPPQRVDNTGSPPMGLVDGDATNTVIWYTGENGTDPARGTAVSSVDDGVTVQYGMRANEDAIVNALKNVAVYAAVTTDGSDPNANAQLTELNARINTNLADKPGKQSLEEMQTDLAGTQTVIKNATDRETQTGAIAQSMLDSIQNADPTEVTTKILALQTSLQASYQMTSSLYQLSLLHYLPAPTA